MIDEARSTDCRVRSRVTAIPVETPIGDRGHGAVVGLGVGYRTHDPPRRGIRIFQRLRGGRPQAVRIFNDTFRHRWERIVDFLKLHYVLSGRTDSRFWIDNRTRESIPDSLRDGLEYWRDHCP
jgi:Tryptophan halogenase